MSVATVDDARAVVWNTVHMNYPVGEGATGIESLLPKHGRMRFVAYWPDGGFSIIAVGPRGALYWEWDTRGEDWPALKAKLP